MSKIKQRNFLLNDHGPLNLNVKFWEIYICSVMLPFMNTVTDIAKTEHIIPLMESHYLTI